MIPTSNYTWNLSSVIFLWICSVGASALIKVCADNEFGLRGKGGGKENQAQGGLGQTAWGLFWFGQFMSTR